MIKQHVAVIEINHAYSPVRMSNSSWTGNSWYLHQASWL